MLVYWKAKPELLEFDSSSGTQIFLLYLFCTSSPPDDEIMSSPFLFTKIPLPIAFVHLDVVSSIRRTNFFEF